MLVFDFRVIGNKLYAIRKKMGMTQLEVAVAADISERTYADIERGSVNMRIETVLRICKVLHVTPDQIFVAEDTPLAAKQEELWQKLDACSPKDKETALALLSVFLDSLS